MKKILLKNKDYITVLFVVLIFLGFYFLISVVPHINYSTNAFDLGIFNQTLFQYSNFELGPNTVRSVETLLADHLELIMFVFTPFYWIFGSFALLFLQIFFVLFGGVGVYLLVKKESCEKKLALLSLILFYVFFGTITALGFDYHNNVVGTMFIPWLFYFFSLRKFRYYYLFLFLFLITKENMALISAFLGFSILIFEDKKYKFHGFITLIVSVVYFLMSLKIISYLAGGDYQHWPYTELGEGPAEALKYVFFHPIETIKLLFNHAVKLKMWVLILASGGIFAIFKPKYFLLIVPVIAQKFFSYEEAFWGYTFHYSVELAPPIIIGAVIFIASLKNKLYRKGLCTLLVLMNLAIFLNIKFYNGESIFRVFQAEYYITSYEKTELKYAISLTENASSVSAQNTIVPHLKNKEIYLFPEKKESDYIILNLNDDNYWPIESIEELNAEIELLILDDQYSTVYDSGGIYVFKSNSVL